MESRCRAVHRIWTQVMEMSTTIAVTATITMAVEGIQEAPCLAPCGLREERARNRELSLDETAMRLDRDYFCISQYGPCSYSGK